MTNEEKMKIIRKELADDYYNTMTNDRKFRSVMANIYVFKLSDEEVVEEWQNGMLDENSEVNLND